MRKFDLPTLHHCSYINHSNFIMETGSIFSNALSLEELENNFGKTMTGILSFLDITCCIDQMPPIPPGSGS